jgi:hypothetical protein
VEFDSSFVFAKPGPGEKRKAQIHDSRIEGVEFAFEAKPLLGGHSTTFCVQVMKNGFEKLGRAILIGIGKCGTFYASHSQMVEPEALRSQLGGNIPQRGSCCKMRKHHCYKLTPSSEGAWLSPKFKAFLFNASEIMSRNKLQQLRKDCTIVNVLNKLTSLTVFRIMSPN